MNPFDFINSISFKKNNLMTDELSEKDYPAFIINRGLSLYADTVLYSNEINMRPNIDNKLAYEYYLNIVRPRKRFSKWHKKIKDEDIETIKHYYKCSESKAIDYSQILKQNQIDELRRRLVIGTTNEQRSSKHDRSKAG